MSGVCITGIGAVSALGTSVEATYAGLRAGRGARRTLADLGALLGRRIDGCPATVAAASLDVGEATLRYLPPAMCLLQRATLEALASAGIHGQERPLAGFGIAVAAHAGERRTAAELAALERGLDPATGGPDARRYAAALRARSPLSALRAQPGLLAGVLSQLHRVHGPCLTFVDENVAGAHAVTHAAEAIADGWCEAWLAGGAFDLDDPWLLLQRDDAGPALGSAAGVLVLESARRVHTRGGAVLAELRLGGAEALAVPGRAVAAVCALDGCIVRGPLADHDLVGRLGDAKAAAVPLAVALAVRSMRPDAIAGNAGGPPPLVILLDDRG